MAVDMVAAVLGTEHRGIPGYVLVLFLLIMTIPDDATAVGTSLDSPPVVGDEVADEEVLVPFRGVEEDEAVPGVEDAPVAAGGRTRWRRSWRPSAFFLGGLCLPFSPNNLPWRVLRRKPSMGGARWKARYSRVKSSSERMPCQLVQTAAARTRVLGSSRGTRLKISRIASSTSAGGEWQPRCGGGGVAGNGVSAGGFGGELLYRRWKLMSSAAAAWGGGIFFWVFASFRRGKD